MNLVCGPIEFRSSAIHGTGGFASTTLAIGDRVIEYVGEKVSKTVSLERCAQGNHCVFYLDEDCNLDGSVEWNPARFLNHSCRPNCHAELIDGRIWITAIRAIVVGEELTFNYSYDLEAYWEHPCCCGSPECVGYIVAEELFEHVRPRNPRGQTGRKSRARPKQVEDEIDSQRDVATSTARRVCTNARWARNSAVA